MTTKRALKKTKPERKREAPTRPSKPTREVKEPTTKPEPGPMGQAIRDAWNERGMI